MSADSEVVMVFPPISDDAVSADLRRLTELLHVQGLGDGSPQGIFGGEFGYGAEFENDTFEMFPFFWGDCECGFDALEWAWEDANPHADTCYQTELERRQEADDEKWLEVAPKLAEEWGLPYQGCAVHCTCGRTEQFVAWRDKHDHDARCGVARPNFRHKPSGTEVRWYKYIGRGMEVDAHGPWLDVYLDCLRSINAISHLPVGEV